MPQATVARDRLAQSLNPWLAPLRDDTTWVGHTGGAVYIGMDAYAGKTRAKPEIWADCKWLQAAVARLEEESLKLFYQTPAAGLDGAVVKLRMLTDHAVGICDDLDEAAAVRDIRQEVERELKQRV